MVVGKTGENFLILSMIDFMQYYEVMNETIDQPSLAGYLLRTDDIVKWNAETWNEYFQFSDFFYDAKGKIIVNQETVDAVEQYRTVSRFIDEMLVRIDRPFDEDMDLKVWKNQFFMRLNNLMRTVKVTIQKFPELLIPLVVEQQRSKVQFAWMNKIYNAEGKVINANVGGGVPEILQGTDMEIIPPSDVGASQRLLNAMDKVAEVYDNLANSITPKEIKSMNVKDRIAALQKLSYIHTANKKFKPNMNFIKINTNKGGREELEAALLDFGNEEE